MASSGPERSLLDRLNALKPSSVTLDRAASTSTSATVDGSAPVTREEALAARLHSLRQQTGSPADGQGSTPSDKSKAGTGIGGHKGTAPHAETPPTLSPVRRSINLTDLQDEPSDGLDDPLTFSDEQALHAFLQDLAAEDDEDGGSDSGSDSEPIVLPSVPSGDGLDGDSNGDSTGSSDNILDDEQAVADLLRSLGGPQKIEASGAPGADADDSEAEDMGREVDRVVAEAHDEADWQHGHKVADADADANAESADDDLLQLQLPAVPTRLVDPPPTQHALCDAADDIAVRLAALKGLDGAEAGLGTADAFGLPSAPTFQPGDQLATGAWRSRNRDRTHGRVGYTDEDQRAWCTVCLEDAVVRCLGCDDDPYCARCWHAMHVGPDVGFDERGHKRVPLVRPSRP